MSHLFNIKSVVLIALIVLLFGLMVGQMLHVLFVATRKENRNPRGAVAYEALLLAHLLVACATVCSAYANHGALLFRMKMISFPIEPMMWINAIALALGLVLAFAHRRPVMTPELIALTTCTPPFIEAVGINSWLIPVLDASFFLFRVSSALVMDIKHRSSAITQLSIGEAVKKLPEGILCTNRDGAIILMNESMRSCLQALGLGTDLSEGSLIWPELTKRATAGNHVRDALLPEGIRLAVSPNETRLFMHDEVTLHRTLCERIIAIDVTLEEDLNERLHLANTELEESNRKLEQTLTQLEEAATEEASLVMKTRVHDSIGQRMTILHHYLESDIDNPEITRNISRLTRNITADLSRTEPEGKDELAALASAFTLAGTNIHLEGTLPENPSSASAIVGIIREAATNALKHGSAKNVYVRITTTSSETNLTIFDDGSGAASTIADGCGIPQMRRTAEILGGTFGVNALAPFTVSATIPHQGASS